MIMPAGIDIGTDGIKLIELQEKKGKLELLKCARSNISGDDLRASLKDLITLSKLSSKRVNISLSGPSVMVRYIEMPIMKKDELKSAIKFEGVKYVPFEMNETILDCAVLDKSHSGNSNRILLVAAKKDKINSYMEIFKEVGLEIASIDVDTVAVLNAFQRLGLEQKQEKVYAMMNIGHKFLNINIVIGKYPYFTRDVLWGGSDVTNRIKEILKLNPSDAEALKRNPADRKPEINAVILPTLEKIISEIRLSFDYFESQFNKSVSKIYISGGTAYLFNMLDFLKENLEIDVVLWNPFYGIKITDDAINEELKKSSGKFAVAVGLALKR